MGPFSLGQFSLGQGYCAHSIHWTCSKANTASSRHSNQDTQTKTQQSDIKHSREKTKQRMHLIRFLWKYSWRHQKVENGGLANPWLIVFALATGFISGGCSAGLIGLISQTVAQPGIPPLATSIAFVALGPHHPHHSRRFSHFAGHLFTVCCLWPANAPVSADFSDGTKAP